MSRRDDERRDAAFVLYESEISGKAPDEVLEDGDQGPLARSLVAAVLANRDELEGLIARNAVGWDLDRIAALERSVMLVALAEVAHPEMVDSRSPIPPAGAIDAAVEVAKEYCGSQAPAFVNGVLDAAVGELGQNPGPDG